MNFDSSQKSYYVSEINRAIFSSRTLDQPTVDAALGTVDPISPYTSEFEPSRITSLFGSDRDAKNRDKVCKALPSPHSMRKGGERVGCGWYFKDGGSSTGAYGSRHGPMDLTLTGGRWIWDLSSAISAEDTKRKTQLGSCANLQFSSYPNLAWCTDGRAIINGKDSCDPSNVVTKETISKCEPCRDSKGKWLGVYSSGIQKYTQEECNTLNGNWYSNGECIRRTGGSYSVICANPSTAAEPSPICTDNNLTNTCIRNFVTENGCSGGALEDALKTGYAYWSTTVIDSNNVLQERQFSIPQGILNDGKLTRQEAINYVTKLKSYQSDPDLRIQTAARVMCSSKDLPYNFCDFPDTKGPPFSIFCIAKQCDTNNWNRSGIAYPSSTTYQQYWGNLKTWNEVKNQVTKFKLWADTNTEGKNQSMYIKYVYGMDSPDFSVCPAYNPGRKYEEGDKVVYEGKTYVRTAARLTETNIIPTNTAAWTSSS